MSVSVTVPEPATISIQSITQGGLGTPINLNNVAGQIEITLNVDAGGRQLSRVDALIGGVPVASQSFGQASAAASAAATSAPVSVVLNVNTAQLKAGLNDLFVPVVFNGQKSITANLFVEGETQPISSNAVPVLMNNEDAAVAPEGIFDETDADDLEPFTDGAGRIWHKGNFFTQFNYGRHPGQQQLGLRRRERLPGSPDDLRCWRHDVARRNHRSRWLGAQRSG
jgi:hypothetical protein